MKKYKVTASRRDEVLKQKAEYDAEYDAQLDKLESQNRAYRQAERAVCSGIENVVRDKIGNTSLELRIRCQPDIGDMLSVTVDNGDNPHDSQALNWTWSVKIADDGEIKKESGSWSGLTAISIDNIENLKESIRILEILNNIDWGTVLNVELPDWGEYVTERHPGNRKSFNRELDYADVEDAMNAGLGIKGHGYKYYRDTAPVIYKIIRQTDTQYLVQEIHEDDIGNESEYSAPYRVNKPKFVTELIRRPFTTVQL